MAKQKLLLVEGSHAVMSLVKRILEREGYVVRCASSLSAARAFVMRFMPDGVILGKEMPDGSGLDYCRELRKNTALPVMFCSGDKGDELAALYSGASDFIKMPYNYDIMKARIYVMLNNSYHEPPNGCIIRTNG